MDVYVDEKWKFSKCKSTRNSSSTKRQSDHSSIRSSSSSMMRKSSSVREGTGSSSSSSMLRKSSSIREADVPTTSSPQSFSNRCAGQVKKQRARFYIVRRCVTMLVCWRDRP